MNGSITVSRDIDGNITGVLSETPASSGETVCLTLDLDLCSVAAEALATTITEINAKRENAEQAGGGAIVVRDCKSGDVLVSESYPSYDLSKIKSIYNDLLNDPGQPLVNRATYGIYNPGSTFKMVTAFAGLRSGAITRYSTVNCTGLFTKYSDYIAHCWVYPDSHGVLDVVGAIQNSCNVFFYWLGDKIGIEPIAEAARAFGLGSKTGIETGEADGVVASREYKRKMLNDGWWAADNMISAIGQGLNRFTPIQIANYITAIANGGTLFKNTVLKCVKSAETGNVIYDKGSEILGKIDDPEGYLGILQSGMRAVVTNGSGAALFGKDYPVKVAAKTGTVQSDTSTQNSGVYVCYAPYDDPQIAVAVVVEGGGSGSALGKVAKAVLDEYFMGDTMNAVTGGEYSLVR